MLAQSFKTAVELNIPEDAHRALIQTLALFETDEMTHVPTKDMDEDDFVYLEDKFTGKFNMSSWSVNTRECGTVACIGGTAQLISGVNFYDLVHDENHRCPKGRNGLYNLFYPMTVSYDDVQVDQAAQALRSYLTTGNVDWRSIVMPTK